MIRRLLLTTLALLALTTGVAGTAFAHNSLDASTPADGATVDLAPADMLLVFAKDVPLAARAVQGLGQLSMTGTARGSVGLASGSRQGANGQVVYEIHIHAGAVVDAEGVFDLADRGAELAGARGRQPRRLATKR